MKSPTSKHSKKNKTNTTNKKNKKNKQKKKNNNNNKMFCFACLLLLFFFNSIRMQIWRITWPTKVRCARASLMGPWEFYFDYTRLLAI